MATTVYRDLITVLSPAATGGGGSLLLENDKALADKVLEVESSVATLQETVGEMGGGGAGLTTQSVDSAEVTITLAENVSYFLSNTALTSVTVTVGEGVNVGRVELATGETLPTFSWPAGMIFVGDDCADGVWTPVVSTRYSVLVSQSGFGIIASVLVVPTLA